MLTEYEGNLRNDILKQDLPRERKHKCKRFDLEFNNGLWERSVISRIGSWSQIWVNSIIGRRRSGSQIGYWDASSKTRWILCLSRSRTNGFLILFYQINTSIIIRSITDIYKVPAKTVLEAWWDHFKNDLVTQSNDSDNLYQRLNVSCGNSTPKDFTYWRCFVNWWSEILNLHHEKSQKLQAIDRIINEKLEQIIWRSCWDVF